MEVVAADRRVAGTVRDVWIDVSEVMIRYLEVEIAGGKRVLLPMTFARVNKDQRRVFVHAILASQFSAVPALARPEQVTFLEEDRICAYYGGGMLYATPQRAESVL
jgi:photosynthetic reaction center H subunit